MLGYRPSVKTVRRGPGQDLTVLICKESKVASWCIQVLLWDRSSRSYEPDRAAAVTACIFDRQKKKIHRFFHRGVRIQIVLSAQPKAIQSGSGFLRWGNGHWISNGENFILLLKGGLEDNISLTNSLYCGSFQGLCYFIHFLAFKNSFQNSSCSPFHSNMQQKSLNIDVRLWTYLFITLSSFLTSHLEILPHIYALAAH